MKRILLSLMIIGVVAVLIGTGTHALFSDTETSTGNTFTAGTLNLQVGAVDPATVTVSIGTIKPTDTGNAATWLIQNMGNINGTLDTTISAITNNENTRSEVETAAGDSTDDPGELGTLLKVALWMDADKGGAWNSGDYYLKSDGTKVSWQTGESSLPSGAYVILNSYGSKSWSNLQTIAASTQAGNFRVDYDFPNGGNGDNVAQSDSCVFSITFTLNQ